MATSGKTTNVQWYVKRNSKSSSGHDRVICDDFTRSWNILESTAKIYALNKTQNMLKIKKKKDGYQWSLTWKHEGLSSVPKKVCEIHA